MDQSPQYAAHPHPNPPSEGEGVARARSHWAILKSLLKWGLFGVLIFFVTRSLVSQLRQIDWSAVHFHPLTLVGATLALIVVYAARTLSFRILLEGYGVRIRWAEASVVGWVPQIGKFIPGHVASLAGAVAILRRFNVPTAIAVSVVLVMDGLAVLTGLVIGSPLLLWGPVKRVLPYGWIGCLLIVVGGVVCLHPRVYGRLLNALLIRLKRAPLTAIPPWHHYIGPVLLGFLQWLLAGIALWLIARSLTPIGARHIPLFVAICGIAYSAGYLAPFTASGLGVREPIFQFTLTPLVGPTAAVVVIAMRLVQTLVEIVMALAGWIVMTRIPRAAPLLEPDKQGT